MQVDIYVMILISTTSGKAYAPISSCRTSKAYTTILQNALADS